jgi:hypothetical protein
MKLDQKKKDLTVMVVSIGGGLLIMLIGVVLVIKKLAAG